MSDISTIFDGVVTNMATLLPSHSLLPNPYIIEDNPDTVLRKGYGVGVGSGQNTKRIINSKHSVLRNIIITITRQTFAKDFDKTKRDTAVKLLLEDHAVLVKDAWNISNFGTGAMRFFYDSDGGIDFVRLEDGFKFIKIETTFQVEYLEDI